MLRAARVLTRSLWTPAKQPDVFKGNVPHITAVKQGELTTAHLGESTKKISFWHDIPYRSSAGRDTFLFVCEIPSGTTPKMEMNKKLEFNPITQDKVKSGPKAGENRFYAHAIPWNYGFIPQTYEDPKRIDERTNCKGDGDPIDVVVITPTEMKTGDIDAIKVLGALALVDEDETDWKIIAMLTSDVRAATVHSVKDIPDVVKQVHDWFRDYKIPDGKPPNKYAFGGQALQPAATIAVIEDTHFDWKTLFAKH